jgi:RNA polymerase sigma factor (sigma-70 family)
MTDIVLNLVMDKRAISTKSMEAHYEDLLNENLPALRRLAGSYTRTASDRDDLVQDIATALWQALPNFRGESSGRTFLFRIAHNRGMAHVIRRRVQVEPIDMENEPSDSRLNPEESFAKSQHEERLFKAIPSLPIPFRQAMTLALEGLDYSQIAEILDISVNNVGVRLTRARKMLRNLMEKNHE